MSIEIDVPKQAGHGDFMTNFALVAAKPAGMNPRAVAEAFSAELQGNPAFDAVEVAGPGFVNLTLVPGWAAGFLSAVQSTDFACSEAANAKKINVEFVSVNPNGPITVGSGRGAAYGSTLCNVLAAAGHTVHREYYINDGVNSEQMRLFAESVRSFVEGLPFPEKGYKGDYVQSVASELTVPSEPPVVEIPTESFAGGVLQKLVEQLSASDDVVRLTPNGDTSFISLGEKSIGSVPADVSQGVVALLVTGSGLPYAKTKGELTSTVTVPTASGVRGVQFTVTDGAAPQELEIRLSKPSGLDWYQSESQRLMIEAQRSALYLFGVAFDTWFSEQSLHDGGEVQVELDALLASGAADENPYRLKLKLAKGGKVEDVEIEEQSAIKAGEEDEEIAASGDGTTVWLRSTKFGDDMDRVLKRRDGRLTYIASDVAYHKDKFNRPENGDKLITVLGPDHHGYIGRLTAVVAAMLLADGQVQVAPSDEPLNEIDAKIYTSAEERDRCRAATALAREKLDVQIFQIVRFVKDGKPAPMRKRDGNIYALIDLVNEIGAKAKPSGTTEEKQAAGRDVARFFYLMRHHDTAMDFDLDLAEKQSDENPVFYAQYAHARICSVLDKAAEAGFPSSVPSDASDPLWNLLVEPKEKTLALKVLDLRYEVARCAEDYAVNRLTTYAVELARTYHAFYDACRVIQPDQPELSKARVALCAATRSGLQAVFGLLGIGAPERMEREN